MQYELLQFEHSALAEWKFATYDLVDSKYLSEGLTYPTTRRFAFNMSHAMQKCDFEFDDVLQLALVHGRDFLSSELGKEWALGHLRIDPALYTENLIDYEPKRLQLLDTIKKNIERPAAKPTKLTVKTATLFEDLKGQLSQLPGYGLLHPTLEI